MATDVERLIIRLEASQARFEKQLAEANNTANRRARSIENRFRQMNANLDGIFARSFRGLTTPLTGLAGALGTREIARYADEWTEAGNKIRAASTSAGVSVRSLNMLKDGANDARTELSAYVDLYARLIRSASGVAKSEEEIALATNLVSKAFKAGGASAQEQAAGILQLGQALGSGVLQGDELRSLRENAPIVAKAIADEFKTTVAGLKKLGADGELTSDRVFKAIINAQKQIEAQFKATNATIKDSVTRVNNEFLAYIGNADASAGASRMLVDALSALADNFQGVADIVVQFATLLAGAFAGKAIAAAVGGIGNAVIALGSFIAALKAGRVAALSFTAALGPIGLLAGGAAAALLLLYNRQDDAAGSASTFKRAINDNETALKTATDATHAQVSAIRQLIAAQAQAARAAATQADADFFVAAGRQKAFRGATGFEFAPFKYATDLADSRAFALSEAAVKLEQQLEEADKILSTKPSGFGGGGGAGDGSSGGAKERANEYERLAARIADSTASLVAETEVQRGLNPLVNDYGYAVERARAEQDLLNAALAAGIEITPDLRQKIGELAHQYATATAEAARLAEEQDRVRQTAEEMRELGKNVMGGFIQDMMNGVDATEALANALGKVADKLLEMALNSLFSGTGSRGGGLLGGFLIPGILHSGGVAGKDGYGHGRAVSPSVFTGAKRYHRGGVAGLQPGEVPAILQKGEVVLPRGAKVSGEGGTTYAPSYNIDARGAEAGVETKIRQALQEYDRGSYSRWVSGFQQAKKRNVA